MSESVTVTVVESNAFKTNRLAQLVSEHGLVAGRDNGYPRRDDPFERDANSVGLYLPTQRPHIKFLGFTRCREWGWIGTIFTSDRQRGANNKNWVFAVYGLENVERLRVLAEEIAQKFGVHVHVRIERESTWWTCPTMHD